MSCQDVAPNVPGTSTTGSGCRGGGLQFEFTVVGGDALVVVPVVAVAVVEVVIVVVVEVVAVFGRVEILEVRAEFTLSD